MKKKYRIAILTLLGFIGLTFLTPAVGVAILALHDKLNTNALSRLVLSALVVLLAYVVGKYGRKPRRMKVVRMTYKPRQTSYADWASSRTAPNLKNFLLDQEYDGYIDSNPLPHWQEPIIRGVSRETPGNREVGKLGNREISKAGEFDNREVVISLRREGLTIEEIAAETGVSKSAVGRIVQGIKKG